jgi:DNA-binding response OmpR family regulator
MPGLSGHQLAERLREQYPSLRVLFMSGFTENVLERYGIVGGDVVRKPFVAAELLEAVRAVLAS